MLSDKDKLYKYHQITNHKLIVSEIKSVMESESPKDPNLVSLYDIADLIRETNKLIKDIKSKYEQSLKLKIKDEWKDCYLFIQGLDFDKKELCIAFKKNFEDNYKYIYFKKENDDLYVSSSETSYYPMQLLAIIGEDLSDLYDEFMAFDNYHKQKSSIQSSNSNFPITIDRNGVNLLEPIFTQNVKENEFCLSSNRHDTK